MVWLVLRSGARRVNRRVVAGAPPLVARSERQRVGRQGWRSLALRTLGLREGYGAGLLK
jgi:hypothetical protein